MSEKHPHIKISAGFYFINRPEGYRGITQESWVFCKSPASLSDTLYIIFLALLDFYTRVTGLSAGEINHQLDLFREQIAKAEVVD